MKKYMNYKIIAIMSCSLIIAFGIGYYVNSAPSATTIGDNIEAKGTVCDGSGDCVGDPVDADFDSGWFAINATVNTEHVFDHNFGSFPTRVMMYVSNSSDPDWVMPLNFLSRGIWYNSPESTWMSKTQFRTMVHHGDIAIYVDANNPAPPGSGIISSETGYMKVLLWK